MLYRRAVDERLDPCGLTSNGLDGLVRDTLEGSIPPHSFTWVAALAFSSPAQGTVDYSPSARTQRRGFAGRVP